MCCWLSCTPAAPPGSSLHLGPPPCCAGPTRSHRSTFARKRIARDLLADVRRLDRQVKTASQAIRQAVRDHGTTLTQVYGVGPVLAAKLLGHAGDITRFPDRDHFASYTGTAPIEASSGDVHRHRLNRGGNRQLNCALHLIAVCQIRDPLPQPRPTTGANSTRPRPPRRPVAASNDTSPTSSTAT